MVLLQYMFFDDPKEGLKSFHMAFLNALRWNLFAELASMAEDVQIGKRLDPFYQGLIMIIVKYIAI